jgi:hypothetical protein
LKYLCHRPAKFYGPHVSLFEPAFFWFERFLEALPRDQRLTQEDFDFVLDVCSEMSSKFKDEYKRRDKFNELLSKYLKCSLYYNPSNLFSGEN